MAVDISNIRGAIRDIPDFPKPGIIFKDITPLLSNGTLFGKTVDLIAERYRGQNIDTVLGIESRGFIIGSALAYKLGAGFSVVRKPGKLPFETHSASYDLEYGKDTLEIHVDAVAPNSRVVIADDLIATGGTAAATAEPSTARTATWISAPAIEAAQATHLATAAFSLPSACSATTSTRSIRRAPSA